MSAEVLFRWKDCEVNLKLARFVVRLLAEHHGRLAQVGPTQCLRDILMWFKQCDPATDESFRTLEAKYGGNPDFDAVCRFLREYTYEDMKRLYPKQCGSLWMAVRGVMRRRGGGGGGGGDPVEQSSIERTSSTSESDAGGSTTSGSVDRKRAHEHVDPAATIKSIRQGADEVSFDLLMLLSNPTKLTNADRAQLEHVEEKMATALEDLRLVLRRLGPAPPGQQPIEIFDEVKDEDFESTYGSPVTDYPSSPSSSYSSQSAERGFANGMGQTFAWYASLTQKLAGASAGAGGTATNNSKAIKQEPCDPTGPTAAAPSLADLAAIESALKKNNANGGKHELRASVGKRTGSVADGIVVAKIASALAPGALATTADSSRRPSVERKHEPLGLGAAIKRLSKTHLNDKLGPIASPEAAPPKPAKA
jgi:hypothetical protein